MCQLRGYLDPPVEKGRERALSLQCLWSLLQDEWTK
jgi:hypothetical protein